MISKINHQWNHLGWEKTNKECCDCEVEQQGKMYSSFNSILSLYYIYN